MISYGKKQLTGSSPRYAGSTNEGSFVRLSVTAA